MRCALRPLRMLAFGFVVMSPFSLSAAVAVDAEIADYKQVNGVSGNLSSVGSDSLNNLMTLWVEGFKKQYPVVNVQVEGKGSGTAPPALIEGTAQLGPMSRSMKSTEKDAFEKKFGYKPTEIKVAIDALAVFVHKDNPVKGLTLTQLDSIFSSTLKRGGKDATTWGDLDLTGEWAAKPISVYGRDSASGTYGYFKEHSLNKGDFKKTVKEQAGSSAVVSGVAGEATAIGYSGIGYLTSGVRALPLGDKADALIEPSYENAVSGKYPLARYLYVYVNRKPGQPMDRLTQEFITFVLSKEGQSVVVKDGYFPLPAKTVTETLKLVQ